MLFGIFIKKEYNALGNCQFLVYMIIRSRALA